MMDSAVPPTDQPPTRPAARNGNASAPSAEPRSFQTHSAIGDQVMRTYIGFLAGWFDLAQLAAGRRLERSGVRKPLLND